MRVPLSWLREYVATSASTAQIAERLAVASAEVERVSRRGVADLDGNLGLYRVGRVVEAGKHPDADRLQLCRVDVGEPEPRQIVCGAWNFGSGATVAVALPGAQLPDGRTLERAKLRGAVSEGMILSERELELGLDQTGILVLDEQVEPGTPLAEILPLSDEVLELELTGNRPDLLAVYGLAREVATLFRAELAPPPGVEPQLAGSALLEIQVEDSEGCPRYIGRLFEDVRVAPSPLWLKARLVGAGIRPISNVVDVTNYVMLALGNPLHAFDRSQLAEGRIVVRRARDGETLTTIDGDERSLTPADLVIADASRPVALAGIMGGADSQVADTTGELLLEAAAFEPTGILRGSERHSLRSESSSRFEKGIDPRLAEQAARYASQLLVELAGARLTGAVDVCAELPPQPVVRLRPERTDALVGLAIPSGEQREILERLGFDVRGDWQVTVPWWRSRDVSREVDLIEEVARIYGLDRIPFTLPLRRAMFGRLTTEQRLRRLVEDVLVGCGLCEAYTPSLVAEDPRPDAIRLPEPLSAELALLRSTLLQGLIESARRNLDAGNERIALFELARVYLPSGEQLPTERWHVGGVVEGGFLRAKGVVETLCGALKVDLAVERARDLPLLHPGKAGRLPWGMVGELHPSLLPGPWGAFELDLDALFEGVPDRLEYTDVISYPALRQDLAFVVSEEVAAGDLVAAAHEAAGPLLRRTRIFDVYQSEQLGLGRKSVAFAVEFQSSERTLSDEDARELRERIVRALAERFGAELRA